MLVYLNGEWMGTEDAKISILDRAFLFGDGIYETLRTYEKTIIALNEHMERLKNSADEMRIDIPSIPSLSSIVEKGVSKVCGNEIYIRIIVTRGNPAFTMRVERSKPNVVVLFEKIAKGRINYEEGVRIRLSRVRKIPPESFNPRVKAIGQPDRIMARLEMKQDDYEMIMLNTKGLVAEGTMSNLFIVKCGVLITPSLDTGILDGITRKYVIKLAKEKGIEVEERYVEVKELFDSDEMFLTHTSGGIVPVGKFENQVKKIGKITRSLMKDFKNFILSK